MNAALRLRGVLERDVSLARLNTWKVGGPADRFYRPADLGDLAGFMRDLPADEPLLWLGFGSNLLVRDKGVRGTVITLRDSLTAITRLGATEVEVEAGAPCAKVARMTAAWGLRGLECFAGIPGCVGGALAMNAGAFGQETWDQVIEVGTVDREGGLHHRQRSDYTIGYRSVSGPDQEWFVSARFRLMPDDPAEIQKRISTRLAERNAKQPMGVASCGSVFRNPPGDHAARLIEAAGLKSYSIGGASVSARHANFIVNEGKASAGDIERLIHHVRTEVIARFGVHLEPEVRMVGEQ